MKKIYLILISFIIGVSSINASTNTIPRTDSDLGVNKKWSITEKNIDNIKRTPRVDATEKIYDFASILTDEEEKTLYDLASDYVEKTNMDLVILTIDKEYSDSEIEDYAADFYDYNDFGLKFPKYSGIILVRNINEYNRFFNIYTFGEAQRYYTYDVCENILDEIYDDLKNDRYLDGFKEFISLANNYYESGPDPSIYVDDNGYMHKVKGSFHPPIALMLIISGITTLITMIVLVKKNKMVKKETLASVYIDKNSIKYNKQVDEFLHSHVSSYTVSSSSGSSGGGSHSGSSGGGHGGGGGRHG